jgi:UDP-N-acetylglucosamine diphosphorylase/glucosamine-1-phosphate N-acetyltransferase
MERNYILFDTPARDLLFPFTHTRPVAACRVGILTIREKWDLWLGTGTSYFTVSHLQEKYPIKQHTVNVYINGHLLPSTPLVNAIRSLQAGQELYKDDIALAKFMATEGAIERISFTGDVQMINYPWDITRLNEQALKEDFTLLTAGRTSAPIHKSNQVSGDVFLEPGAVVRHSILNGSTGPIYIGRNAEIMEGCLIRGAFALGEGGVLKMGTKIYGATSLGPGCVGGGEIKNVVMFGYSNKGHDGYLGDAVLGEWCNLGGNTTCSNLKNNGGDVRVWVEARGEAIAAGKKCGLIMGDYSRCGIGTLFNTGTVVGVSCNIFGAGYQPKFVPSFSWGFEVYRLAEVIKDAGVWMQFKGQQLGEVEERLLTAVYQSVGN